MVCINIINSLNVKKRIYSLNNSLKLKVLDHKYFECEKLTALINNFSQKL